jgi:hypothetical protein
MPKKKKRRGPTGYRTERGGSSAASRSRPTGGGREGSRVEPSGRQRRPAQGQAASRSDRSASPWGSIFRGRDSARGRVASLQPPVGVSFARGLSVVGSSPALLVVTFLAVLGLWLGFSGYGVVQSAAPQAMVLLLSLPPLHSFLDIDFLARGRIVSPAQVVAFSLGVVVVRAVLASVWMGLILESFRGQTGRAAIRPALGRAARSFASMVGVELGFLTLAAASIFLAAGLLGPSLGQLAIIGALLGGLYFFSLTPVVAAAESRGTMRAARLSINGARVPGPQHMLFTTAYLALTLFVSVVTPGSRVAAATPSIQVWALALLVSFVHVGALAALTYRWLLIREHAIARERESQERKKGSVGPLASQRGRAR